MMLSDVIAGALLVAIVAWIYYGLEILANYLDTGVLEVVCCGAVAVACLALLAFALGSIGYAARLTAWVWLG